MLFVVITTWLGPVAAFVSGGANRPPNRVAPKSMSGPSKFWIGLVTTLTPSGLCMKLLIAGSINGSVLLGSIAGLILFVLAGFFSRSSFIFWIFATVSAESG